jgi:hypothetical protein
MHTRFLHEDSYSMGIDQEADLVDVKPTSSGFIVSRRNDPSNVEGMQFVDAGMLYSRVSVSMLPLSGPAAIYASLPPSLPSMSTTASSPCGGCAR